MPGLVTVDVAPELAVGEPDVEVQELLRRSAGRNLGMDYLPGALDFEAGADGVDPALAGRVLWFDALIGNVDRSWRNPNMLFWHGRLQLIDHGAALTFHHSWPGAAAAVGRPYDAAAHALIECEPDVPAADAALGAAGDPVPARGGAGARAGRVARGGAWGDCASATSPSCSRGWGRGRPGCPAWSPRRRPGERAAVVRLAARTGPRGWARRRPRG